MVCRIEDGRDGLSDQQYLLRRSSMHPVARRLTVIVAVLVVVVGTAAGAFAAARQFGYHKVREGLPTGIGHFSLTSTDIHAGQPIPQRFRGCTGPGVSPELTWSGAPAATRSFAVTVFDADAPTGSGFWHWIAWDLPAGTTSLPTGAQLPSGAVNGTNDGGGTGYTGPCPPVGDVTHHYRFTVVALDVPTLQLPADTHAAAVSFTIGQHAIAAAALTATARR
jgi:Raf kinase inhibitor-like YbhB/YbcL family protein